MKTTSLNWGCGLIATAPLFAGHLVFPNQLRFLLLSWFCSFVCTVLLIICSLSSLFTKNPWFILLWSLPFDVLGKVLLKFFGCRFKFLSSPHSRINLGFACGLGFALSHVLTLYLPFVFDQPYSIDFHRDYPNYLPDCLDLAIVNHMVCLSHMAISLILFRFASFNIFAMYFIVLAYEYGIGALSQIPILWVKYVVMFVVCYGSFIFGIISFRSMPYENPNVNLNHESEYKEDDD